MKVKILKTCAGLEFSYLAGQEVEIGEAQALDLIGAGHAEPIKRQAEAATIAPAETADQPKPKPKRTTKPKAE